MFSLHCNLSPNSFDSGLFWIMHMLRSQIMDLFSPYVSILKWIIYFAKSSTTLGTWSEIWINNSVNRFYCTGQIVSKDTAFYHNICLAKYYSSIVYKPKSLSEIDIFDFFHNPSHAGLLYTNLISPFHLMTRAEKLF